MSSCEVLSGPFSMPRGRYQALSLMGDYLAHCCPVHPKLAGQQDHSRRQPLPCRFGFDLPTSSAALEVPFIPYFPHLYGRGNNLFGMLIIWRERKLRLERALDRIGITPDG